MVATRVTTQQVKAEIDAHIDVCAVRYESIEKEMRGVNARLKRLETILIGSAGAIILLLIGLVAK
jgi:chaperonin cofactor prefoldin